MIPFKKFSVTVERPIELCSFTLIPDEKQPIRVRLTTNIMDTDDVDGDTTGQLTLTLSEFHTFVQSVNRIDKQLKETIGDGEYWSEDDYE
ncbi:hypothetical protein [Bifidobacterium tissieri]|uniref:Uncharacterized protein n=1 Tax=Bifidobacterium tissieri TaxID=1630162 RepID=A0A5M9ZME3_9BIFI|nr:hypothetical protein [Bifidobacterium tissieri]KAA8828645.1 hypothetical protein EM849_11450 [Bifidobacterium tissieri]KAA8831588.1 hypothetical protein EMO89_02365 [Bifidobacterium tissieri]